MTRLLDVARQFSEDESHKITKPHRYYEIYEQYLAPLRESPIKLLELGVFSGESLWTWASYFKNATVVGIDHIDKGVNLEGHANAIFEQMDQSNQAALEQLCQKHAPDGFDVIIDDASHIGWLSQRSFEILFPRLKPSGFYIVEDWGTGYWPDWIDGDRYTAYQAIRNGQNFPGRIPSHDAGMVGFVKSLIDEVGAADIGMRTPGLKRHRVDFMHLYPSIAILKKKGA